MSLSGEEQRAAMSLSGEEQRVAMSVELQQPAVPAPGAGAPRFSRLGAAVIVVLGLSVAGALLGVLWAFLAPPIHGVVALTRSGQRVHTYLGNESDNFFVAAAMLIGLLTMLAIVSAVLVWQWRAHRGPVIAAALCLGAVAAAAAAASVGAALVHWRYGPVVYGAAPVTPQNRVFYFTEAPPVFLSHGPLQIVATLLLPAAVAALVYALMVVATPRDDLGGWPTAAHQPLPAPQPVSTVS